jgi:hypothetical protein
LYLQFFLFLLVIAFSVPPFSLGHCIFSPSFNVQEKKEGLKMQWPREKGRTENTMAKRKGKG